ncbi:MAG: iron-sulfur cluster assembly scaffold protein [Thermodesulfobacteriota bacterium]
MKQADGTVVEDKGSVREMLSGSGYSQKAIDLYLEQANMGSLSDADQVSELTGPCGDTMKVYLKLEQGRIKDAKIQVLGCPGAVASAMVAMDLAKGKTVEEALEIKDRDIVRILEELPEQKVHCVRLAVKALQKALHDYAGDNGAKDTEEHHATV